MRYFLMRHFHRGFRVNEHTVPSLPAEWDKTQRILPLLNHIATDEKNGVYLAVPAY